MKKRRKNRNLQLNTLKSNILTSVKSKWRIISLLFITFVVSLFLFNQFKTKILLSNMFVIEEIVVKGNHLTSSEEILGDAEIAYETPFFKLDNKLIEKNILRNNRIKRAIVTKKFPNVVEIFVEEKKTVALVTLDKTYELAMDGSLMKLNIRDCDFPIITGFTSLTPLQGSEKNQLKREMRKVTKLLQELDNIDANFLHEFSEIRINKNNEYVAFLRNGTTSILFGKGDLYNKGLDLYSLLKSHKNDLNSYNEIDLRYKNLAYAR